MKKIILIFLLILLVILSVSNCYASSFFIRNQYYLDEQGIFLDLSDDETNYHNIMEELNDKNSTLNQNEEAKQNYINLIKQYNVVLLLLDSLEADVSKQILISSVENQESTQIYNLNTFDDNKLQYYYEQNIKELKNTMEIVSSEIIKTKNGEVYIFYETTSNSDGKTVNSYSYFTVKNKKYITINITSLDANYEKKDANNFMEHIQIYNQNNNFFQAETDYSMLVVYISLLALITILIVKKFVKPRHDVELSENEKNKYKKANFFYIFFIFILIRSLILNSVSLIVPNDMFSNLKTVGSLVNLQTLLIIIVYLIILIFIIRKKKIDNIQKLLFNLGIASLAILFLLGCCSICIDETLTLRFYGNVLLSIISTTSSTIIWGCYFRFSKKVKFLSNTQSES